MAPRRDKEEKKTKSKEKDRPRIAPLSGAEANLTPGMFPKRRGNCYAFALNLKSLQKNDKLQPGELAGKNGDAAMSCSALRSLVANDAARVNIRPSKANAKCPKGFYKVAGVVDPGEDYHFMRQVRSVTFKPKKGETKASIAKDFEVRASSVSLARGLATVTHGVTGFWAHKRGLATGAIFRDARGKVIDDPRTANMNYGNLNYSNFCGFNCVRAKPRPTKEMTSNSKSKSSKKPSKSSESQTKRPSRAA
jgi:hypothetical protein